MSISNIKLLVSYLLLVWYKPSVTIWNHFLVEDGLVVCFTCTKYWVIWLHENKAKFFDIFTKYQNSFFRNGSLSPLKCHKRNTTVCTWGYIPFSPIMWALSLESKLIYSIVNILEPNDLTHLWNIIQIYLSVIKGTWWKQVWYIFNCIDYFNDL